MRKKNSFKNQKSIIKFEEIETTTKRGFLWIYSQQEKHL